MAKMKSKEEIGAYIGERIKELGLSQSDLAGEIADIRGSGYDRNSLKDNVSKWIKGKRYPGTEYIYYLAQVLKVSIEKLLVAGAVCSEYDDRPLTLYSVAKGGKIEELIKIMNTENHVGEVVGTQWDEYGKTLIDYIIQFDRKDLMEYLFESGRIYKFRVFYDDDDWRKITSFAVKHDSLLIFSRWIGRDKPIRLPAEVKLFEGDVLDLMYDRHILPYEDVKALFNAPGIFKYITTPFDTNEENLTNANKNIDENSYNTENFETLNRSFNLILNIAVLEKLDVADKLLKIGRAHNEKLKKQLSALYGKDGWKIIHDGQVILNDGIQPKTSIVFASIAKELYDDEKTEGMEIIK